METRGDFGLSARERDSWAQTSHDVGPVEMGIDKHGVVLVAVIAGERRAIGHGHIDHGGSARAYAVELGRGDADDRHGKSVDADGSADYGRVTSEAGAPVRVAEHGDLV